MTPGRHHSVEPICGVRAWHGHSRPHVRPRQRGAGRRQPLRSGARRARLKITQSEMGAVLGPSASAWRTPRSVTAGDQANDPWPPSTSAGHRGDWLTAGTRACPIRRGARGSARAGAHRVQRGRGDLRGDPVDVGLPGLRRPFSARPTALTAAALATTARHDPVASPQPPWRGGVHRSLESLTIAASAARRPLLLHQHELPRRPVTDK